MKLTREEREAVQKAFDALAPRNEVAAARYELEKLLRHSMAAGFVYGGNADSERTHGSRSKYTRVQLTCPDGPGNCWSLNSRDLWGDPSMLNTQEVREVGELMIQAADAWEKEDK